MKSDENAKLRRTSAREKEREVYLLQTTGGLVDGIPHHIYYWPRESKKEVEINKMRPVQDARF